MLLRGAVNIDDPFIISWSPAPVLLRGAAWALPGLYAPLSCNYFGPDTVPNYLFDGHKGLNPRRRLSDGERTKARSRGKAARKARRAGR